MGKTTSATKINKRDCLKATQTRIVSISDIKNPDKERLQLILSPQKGTDKMNNASIFGFHSSWHHATDKINKMSSLWFLCRVSVKYPSAFHS